MRYDATLKKLFQQPPNKLLSFALGKTVNVVRMLPTDLITVENLHPDTLFEDAEGEVIHPEIHGYPMSEFACRNLIYYGLILRDYKRPPKQVVFWVGRNRVGISEGLSHPPHLKYSYPVIDVRDIDAAILMEGGGIGESIFAILCKLDNPRQIIGQILRRISALPAGDQKEAVAQLLVLSGLRDVKPIVQEEILHMPLSFDIHENEFLEEVFQEGMEKGVQEGLAKGVQEGLEKGRLEQAQKSLRKLLEAKFGPVSATAQARIAQAPFGDLDTWMDRALASTSLEDVFAAH